jgi:hypothetical protein
MSTVTVMAEEARFHGQRLSILARLSKGPATNAELSQIAQRFGSRLKELRTAGHIIDTRRVDAAKGVFEYTLRAQVYKSLSIPAMWCCQEGNIFRRFATWKEAVSYALRVKQ